jgi:acetyl esterase/lipase
MTNVINITASVGLSLILCTASLSPAVAHSTLEKSTVVYREVDGHKIRADVYRPKNDKVCPVIVWLHGGALINGNRTSADTTLLKLAEDNDFALVSFDYRLAPETKLPALMSDIEAAFRWLATDGAKEFHLDPSKIVVAGGSAGGYLALTTGYRVDPRPKAVVAFYGYGSLNGDWYAQPSPHACHNKTKITREEALQQTNGTVVSDNRDRKGNGSLIYLYYRQQGSWPEEVSGFDLSTIAEEIVPYEPVRNVTSDYPPTLLIHGTSDTDVPYEESKMFAEQLEQHGIPHKLITIENAEHGLGGGDQEKVKQAYQSMREFVVEHLTDNQ